MCGVSKWQVQLVEICNSCIPTSTIFYFVVGGVQNQCYLFKLQGFVFYYQGLAIPALACVMFAGNSKFTLLWSIIAIFFSIWNLDILRFFKLDVCLGTDSYTANSCPWLGCGCLPSPAHDLLIHLYDNNFKPLVIIWKPFKGIFSLLKETGR